jgi:polysaccharide biosynthesis PFTS motif protein
VNYLEQIGARVVYIETSQYIEPLDLEGNELHDDFEHLNEWSEIWTVSNDRMNYLTEFNKEKTFTIKNLGLPWMFDHSFEIGSITKPILSIFDVEPHRFYFGWSTYNIYGLQEIQFATRFLEDIMSVAIELDLYVLHKPKRTIGGKRYPQYSKLISYFIENFPNNYCLLEPDVSLQKIIQNSQIVIATPFTSALLANPEAECTKIYFDPLLTGITPSVNTGFDLVSGEKALKNYINRDIGVKRNSP